MMKYTNRLLSIVAASLLSVSSANADSRAIYIPLSTKANDSSLILFGVNGFSDGVGTSVGLSSTAFSPSYTELEDTPSNDDLATSGLSVAGGDLASVQGLDHVLTGLKIGVDITGVVYSATEPVRSMYVRVNSTTPMSNSTIKLPLRVKGWRSLSTEAQQLVIVLLSLKRVPITMPLKLL
jgi:hypothetical protein